MSAGDTRGPRISVPVSTNQNGALVGFTVAFRKKEEEKKHRSVEVGLLYQKQSALADPRGVPGMHAPWGSKFFHFHAIYGKNLKNNSNFGSWRTPLVKILDPPLVWNITNAYMWLCTHMPSTRILTQLMSLPGNICLQHPNWHHWTATPVKCVAA